jgi:radical SAM protein with 4Fe4S-binding SPASM domain
MRELYWLRDKFNKKMTTLIFFVTYTCNFKCKGCFYENLHSKERELNLEEIKKISKTFPKFKNLLISGGEPFLRENLPEICKIFYENNKVKSINIPTNAFLTKEIVAKTREILELCKDVKLAINLSLDGFKETHDYVRGVKGSFERLIKTEKELIKLKKDYKNLDVGIITTIYNRNYSELLKLHEFVKESMPEVQHSFEVMRGNPKDKNMSLPPIEKIKEILNCNMDQKIDTFKSQIEMNKLKSLRELQIKVLNGGKLPFTCLAGKVVIVLEPNGEIKLCELLESVGNLRDYNYNFKSILKTKEAKNQIQMIKKTRCSCTHCVFLLNSLEHTPTKFFREILR